MAFPDLREQRWIVLFENDGQTQVHVLCASCRFCAFAF